MCLSSIMPPPMPVENVKYSDRLRQSLASASAARLASFSTMTGKLKSALSLAAISKLRHGRLPSQSTRLFFTGPGMATEMILTCVRVKFMRIWRRRVE